jgi:hypothetical protein
MKRWDEKLWLFTPAEFEKLPNGFELKGITGKNIIKGQDEIDMDVRFGVIAFGVENPSEHPEAELLTVFMLS